MLAREIPSQVPAAELEFAPGARPCKPFSLRLEGIERKAGHQWSLDSQHMDRTPTSRSATRELFNVRTPPDALSVLLAALPEPTSEAEDVSTSEALGRVLAEDIHSPDDLPTFRRSTMDGFAVRAADTFGATEGLPS